MGEFNVNKTDGSLEQTAGMPSDYPATQVMLSDGVTSVEDALDELADRLNLKYFDITAPAGTTTYDFSNEKPSDLNSILTAMSIGGGGAIIKQVGTSVMYFDQTLVSNSTIRILYVAT